MPLCLESVDVLLLNPRTAAKTTLPVWWSETRRVRLVWSRVRMGARCRKLEYPENRANSRELRLPWLATIITAGSPSPLLRRRVRNITESDPFEFRAR